MPDEKWYPGKATVAPISVPGGNFRGYRSRTGPNAQVSNAYLGQVERGIHEPSLRVLAAVAEALSLPLEDLAAPARPDAETVKPGRDVDAVTAAIRPSRGCPSLRRRHFSRCTPAIWQMAIHSGNPSIETQEERTGRLFVLTRSYRWSCRKSNPLQKIALTCGNADKLATRNDAKIREIPADTRRVLMTSTRRRTTMCRDLP